MNPRLKNILVVDDDAAIRGVVCEVLRDDGFNVSEAASGIEAMKQIDLGNFCLVITDIRMPGISGIELLQRIKAGPDDIHVIIMTSHSSMDSAVKALKLGAYDYLSKPFEDLELISSAARRAIETFKLANEKELLIASLTKNNEELEKLNRFFREMAIRDGLTGLFNHRHFNEALTSEVERSNRYGRQMSLIFIDVDHFKRYNDTHGHQMGDELLKSISQVIGDNIRDTDMLARWGGEEFVVMAPETSSTEVHGLAEKIRQMCQEHAYHGSQTQPTGRITVSLGIATLKRNETAQSLVFRADQAVYRAKDLGRNNVCLAA